MSRRDGRRLVLLALGAVALAGGGGWAAFEALVHERSPLPPAPPPTPAPVVAAAAPVDPPAAEPALPEARIVAVKGQVQRSEGSEGWTAVREGDRLRSHERVRTSAGGAAELALDGHSSMLVAESTEVSVEELDRAVHRFRLVRGRVTADYAPDGQRTLRIEGAEGQAASVTAGGRFSVLAAPGAFSVATERGRVDLTSAGAVVSVGAGQQALARAGAAPREARPIPAEVLLLAAQGPGGCGEIRGRALPGAEVEAAGVRAAVQADGRFVVRLRESGAREAVVVRTRDASGRRKERTVRCGGTQQVSDIEIQRWKKRPR